MFGVVISSISWPWFPKDMEVFLEIPIMYPMKTHIHCFGAFLFNDFVVYLNSCGVVHLYRGGWLGSCVSINVVRIGTAAWPLRNKTPYSASAADAMMLRIIFHIIKINPLIICVYSLNVSASGLGSLRKNTPLYLLLALVTNRYEASL